LTYHTQFLCKDGRAHAGQAKIKSRLIGGLDPDEAFEIQLGGLRAVSEATRADVAAVRQDIRERAGRVDGLENRTRKLRAQAGLVLPAPLR
jgi:hypothetical protein